MEETKEIKEREEKIINLFKKAIEKYNQLNRRSNDYIFYTIVSIGLIFMSLQTLQAIPNYNNYVAEYNLYINKTLIPPEYLDPLAKPLETKQPIIITKWYQDWRRYLFYGIITTAILTQIIYFIHLIKKIIKNNSKQPPKNN